MSGAPKPLNPTASLHAYFGWRVRELRGDKPAVGIARHINKSVSLVSRIETAEVWPTVEVAAALDQALDAGGELIALQVLVERDREQSEQRSSALDRQLPGPWNEIGQGRDLGHDDADCVFMPVLLRDGRVEYMRVPRRAFLAMGGAGLAAALSHVAWDSATADDLDRLALALAAPDRVDMPIVGYFRTILACHRHADDQIGPQFLRVPVGAQFAIVMRFVAAADGEIRRELQRVGAEYAQFASWLALDAGDLAAAQRLWERARGLALDAGDQALIGYLFARKVTEIWHTKRNLAAARAAAEAAARPEYRKTPAVEAEAAVRAACVCALDGDLDGCRAQLDHAVASLARSDPTQEPAWIYWIEEGGIAHSAGRYLDWLGRPDLALPEIDRSLALLPSDRVRDRGEVLASRAAACAAGDLPEEAATAGEAALALVRQTGSARSLELLGTVDARLRRWSTTAAVRDFHERFVTARREVAQNAIAAP